MRSRLVSVCSLIMFQAVTHTVDGQCPQEKVTASDAACGDSFGSAVDTDGTVAVIASPSDDHVGANAGSVYVYRRDGADWVEEQKLIASDAGANDRFGHDVALSGGRILVGAWDASYGVFGQAGAAYTFTYDGSTWTEEQRLEPSDPKQLGHFGWATALDGDVMVISAIHEQFGGGDESGAAYVFRHNGTQWVQEQKLVGSDTATFDYFGTSVGVDGNVIVVGARLADPDGAAYVFRHNGTSWVEEQKLLPTGGRRRFGVSVDIEGQRLVVGADDNGTPAFGGGAVFSFVNVGSSWNLTQTIVSDDLEAGDAFGRRIQLDLPFLVSGAPGNSELGLAAGAVYLFELKGQWTQRKKLTASDAQPIDNLGNSVSVAKGHAIGGASSDDANPTDSTCDSGASYVFDLRTCLVTIPTLSEWGVLILALGIIIAGGWLCSRRVVEDKSGFRVGNERSMDMRSVLIFLLTGPVVCILDAAALAEQPLRPRTPPQDDDDR